MEVGEEVREGGGAPVRVDRIFFELASVRTYYPDEWVHFRACNTPLVAPTGLSLAIADDARKMPMACRPM